MAEFPALPLWTDAYLGDTTHLSCMQHGAYLLLLITAWRTADCCLPDDDRLLARYARCTSGQWKRLRPVLEPFFVIENDKWNQKRLTDTRIHVSARRESAAANGRLSALKRQGRHATKRGPSVNEASAKREQNPDSTISISSSTKDKESLVATKRSLPDDWEPQEFGPETSSRAITDGWPPAEFKRQLEAFKAHHGANGSRFSNWQKAWATWVINSPNFLPKAQTKPGASSGNDAFYDAMAADYLGKRKKGD